eukprot:jgi/Tetstr1/466418/TSEL_010946.t1
MGHESVVENWESGLEGAAKVMRAELARGRDRESAKIVTREPGESGGGMGAGTRAGAGADVAAWCAVSPGSGLGESEGWLSSCITARVAVVAASCAMVRICSTIWDICSAEAACLICTARCAAAELTCPQEAGDRGPKD